MSEVIGMMEGAFFVSRTELLKWIEDVFHVNYTKVEQCANGALYCQILDAIFPGRVAMKRVNWNAKHEYEFIKNYKVLQSAFDRLGIEKHIEVEKLIKAKYQDNLEMLQWMKRYYDLKVNPNTTYDPDAVRAKTATEPPTTTTSRAGPSPRSKPQMKRDGTHSSLNNPTNRPGLHQANGAGSSHNVRGSSRNAPFVPAALKQQLESLQLEVTTLTEQLTEETMAVSNLEREREFYFGKLRDIEILCQQKQETGIMDPFMKQIMDIL